MKRSIAILLLLAMILGVFAGCKQTVVEQPTEEPTVAPTGDNVPANAKEDLAAAAEYLKTYYKDALTLTARDFTRLGAVRVGLEEYPITWSVNVPEDVVKIVVNDDGTVTIDIADGIKEETPYVLTATLTDAYGNVETVDFEYTIPASLGTMQEIVDLAYALENGASLDVEATLTGEIISVNTPYDAGYKNVTVTIKVAEREDYPIMCYRLKGEGADTITVGDTITVTGILKNYNGTIEFDAGCVLEEVIKGNFTFDLPEDPKEIVDMAYALGVGESIPVKVTLTGKVSEFRETYTDQYKNISVWIQIEGRESKPILAYRLVSGEGGDVKDVAVGDTITVTGTIVNYNGTIEFNAKCTMDARVSGGGKPPAEPQSNFWSTVPVVGETYYLFMDINGVNYYFNGKMSGNYLGTSINPGDAVEVTVEQSNGYGYRFFFMDKGVKKYIEIYEYTRDDGKNRGAVRIVEEPTVTFYWSGKAHTYTVYGGITNDLYFLGTYGTYTTFSVSSIYYITGNNAPNAGVTQYIADLMKPADAPAPEEPPVVPETPSALTFVDAPVAGTAYKFAMKQNGISGSPVLGITGQMSNFYYATTETESEMVDVYLEETTGGYHIYFMDGATKTYLDVIPRSNDATKTNVVFQTSGEHTVYVLNTEYKYVKTTVNGTDWYLGTYGTNKTVSASKTSYIEDTSKIGVSQFCAWFATAGEGGSTEPEQPEQPEEPDVPTEPTYVTSVVPGTAYKLGLHSTDKNATYYFTGAMSGYYGATDTTYEKGVDVFVEETTGGYHLYFLNASGTKQYINLVASGTYKNFKFGTSASSVFTWDAEKNALYTTVGSEVCYIGTYGSFVTMGVLQTSKLKDTDYIARLYTQGGSSEPEQPEQPEQPEEPEQPTEPTYVTSVAPGTAYKLGLYSSNKKATYYFIGTMSGYYGATDTAYEKGVDVFVEETTGGYYLYFLNTSGTKQYINLVASGTYKNFKFGTSASSVFTWDAEKNALYTTVGSEVCYIGTYDSYVTMGVLQTSKLKDTDYIARLYTMGGSSEPEVNPDEEAAKAVDDLIDAIGTVTKDSEAAIKAARDAYNALTDAQKALVSKLAVLEAAEKALEELNKPTEPEEPAAGLEEGVAYKIKADNSKGTLWFNGTISSGRFNGTYSESEAVSVYVENVTDGFLLYILNGTTKTYICIEDKSAGGSFSTAAATATVFEWNAEKATAAVADDSNNRAFGCGATSTYANFSAYDLSGDYNWGQFVAVNGGTTEPEVPEVNEDEEAAKAVDALIDEIGTVTKDSESKIKEARAAYEALTADQKKLVTKLAVLEAAEKALEELNKPVEPETPVVPGNSATYTMADYVVSGEMGGGEVIRELDANVTFTISSGWISGDTARIYKGSTGVIESKKPVSTLVVNAGYKASTFDVYTSEDGETWTKHSNVAYTVAYADVTINFETPVKYIKLDAVNQQIRIKTITVTFAEEKPAEPVMS